jgi:hypothetical protein
MLTSWVITLFGQLLSLGHQVISGPQGIPILDITQGYAVIFGAERLWIEIGPDGYPRCLKMLTMQGSSERYFQTIGL